MWEYRYTDELYHHGIKGMKWGIRRTAAQLGHLAGRKVKSVRDNRAAKKQAKRDAEERARKTAEELRQRRKPVRDLSVEELNTRIARLEKEKRYKDLLKEVEPMSKGKKLVNEILESSAKNIGIQTATFLLGTGVNKMAKEMFKVTDDVVNPKKGQKDK